MENFRLYWEFHKSTLLLNWVASIALALLTMTPIYFPVATMTGGPFISLLYKEITARNEYYFYYNRGIPRINLIIFSMTLNILLGVILTYIVLKCQAA